MEMSDKLNERLGSELVNQMKLKELNLKDSFLTPPRTKVVEYSRYGMAGPTADGQYLLRALASELIRRILFSFFFDTQTRVLGRWKPLGALLPE